MSNNGLRASYYIFRRKQFSMSQTLTFRSVGQPDRAQPIQSSLNRIRLKPLCAFFFSISGSLFLRTKPAGCVWCVLEFALRHTLPRAILETNIPLSCINSPNRRLPLLPSCSNCMKRTHGVEWANPSCTRTLTSSLGRLVAMLAQ